MAPHDTWCTTYIIFIVINVIHAQDGRQRRALGPGILHDAPDITFLELGGIDQDWPTAFPGSEDNLPVTVHDSRAAHTTKVLEESLPHDMALHPAGLWGLWNVHRMQNDKDFGMHIHHHARIGADGLGIHACGPSV